MAKVERGTFAVLSSGNKTYVFNDYTLVPEYISFSVVTNSGNERSLGGSDGAVNYCGNTGTYNDLSSTKCIQHYRNLSSVKAKTIEGNVTGFDVGEFYMNFGTVTETTFVNYTVYGS